MRRLAVVVLPLILLAAGCAKFNTYFNAKRSFDQAEHVRSDAIKKHQDPPKPTGAQRTGYETAIRKSQKILDQYPGHSLTDDVLFLQAKSHHRLESYRQSIRKLNLLFQNYPATPYLEEALYLQALNFLLIGDLATSQDYLDRLEKNYPDSQFQAETLKVSGDNAFTMRDWEAAATAFRQYLDLEGEIQERERVGLRLAECYWEMRDYYPAAEVLQEVSQDAQSAEVAFRARLLRARVHVRMQDYEIVALLVAQLKDEAEIYSASGDVVLIEAEALIAQGLGDEASPLLESMPAEWETPVVKARAGEIMGNIYLERGEWEDARQKFQVALLKRDELEDADRVRRLNDSLKDYLAADAVLPDAKPDRVPGLKLLQANAMLFGFLRPHMAATLYGEAVADTAADTTVAARALYGAYLTYRNYLDNPDSAAIYQAELETRFPDSPQAYEARGGADSDLLGYLMEIRTIQQAENLANLSDTEREALQTLGDMESGGVGRSRRGMAGVRRRLVYLSRRSNLLFPPPEDVVRSISTRQAAKIQAEALDAVRQAEFDSLQAEGAAVPLDNTTGLGSGAAQAGDAVQDGDGHGTQDSPNKDQAAEDQQALDEKAADKDDKDDKEKNDKKKQDENWDFLR